MATGLRVPVGVGKSGSSALTDGDDHDRKVIFTALGDCSSENAFQQDIGLGADMVFDVGDEALRGKVLQRLFRVFDEFERLKRYKLVRDSVRFVADSEKQEQQLSFRYVNMETDEARLVVLPLTR